MAYPQFMAEGWPIGSGMVERANKLVVEDRLKGAGMHWADGNVNPMLALRNAICNERWGEVWEMIERQQQRQMVVQREARRMSRQSAATAAVVEEQRVLPDALNPIASSPAEPVAKPLHPWKRPWSIRRQRELAGAT
jgi:hypothetical protein